MHLHKLNNQEAIQVNEQLGLVRALMDPVPKLPLFPVHTFEVRYFSSSQTWKPVFLVKLPWHPSANRVTLA